MQSVTVVLAVAFMLFALAESKYYYSSCPKDPGCQMTPPPCVAGTKYINVNGKICPYGCNYKCKCPHIECPKPPYGCQIVYDEVTTTCPDWTKCTCPVCKVVCKKY